MKPYRSFKDKYGNIAVNIAGDYITIVNSDLDKFKYDLLDYKIFIEVNNNKIEILIYKN